MGGDSLHKQMRVRQRRRVRRWRRPESDRPAGNDWSAGAEARVLFIQMKEESPWRPRGLLSHHRTHPFMSRIGFNNPLSSSSPPPGRHGGHLLCTEPEDQSARVGARGGVQSRSETQHEETHLDRHVGQLDPLARPTPDPADPASALHFSASLRVRRPKDVKAREKKPKVQASPTSCLPYIFLKVYLFNTPN